eukprot:2244146-Prymnesium_polylepis.1
MYSSNPFTHEEDCAGLPLLKVGHVGLFLLPAPRRVVIWLVRSASKRAAPSERRFGLYKSGVQATHRQW